MHDKKTTKLSFKDEIRQLTTLISNLRVASLFMLADKDSASPYLEEANKGQ